VEFAGKALVQIVLSEINAVGGFTESIVVHLANCRMWLVSDVKCVDGQLFQEVVVTKEMMIS